MMFLVPLLSSFSGLTATSLFQVDPMQDFFFIITDTISSFYMHIAEGSGRCLPVLQIQRRVSIDASLLNSFCIFFFLRPLGMLSVCGVFTILVLVSTLLFPYLNRNRQLLLDRRS
jgi:hypothetical protein